MAISLVIMAAGIGSRFGGGIKQLEPVGPHGELLMEYSVHDAIEAGFARIVFVLRKDIEKDFHEIVGERVARACAAHRVEVSYAFQALEDLPEGFAVPTGRTKPWGTCQAVLACRDVLDGPFAVLNADDYYGKTALRLAHDFLQEQSPSSPEERCCLVGFRLGNTLSDNGTVTRGLCRVDERGMLTGVEETYAIENTPDGPVSGGRKLDAQSLVSMNLWGLTQGTLRGIESGFARFLRGLSESGKDPLRAEYVLPTAMDERIRAGAVSVRVLETPDVWYGMTYREDLPAVRAAFRKMHGMGIYGENLFDEMKEKE